MYVPAVVYWIDITDNKSMISWKEDLWFFVFWSIIKPALNKNNRMTDENRLADHYEKIGWALWVRIDWAVLMRIEWELDENCQLGIGWELSGENWMRIVRWKLDENCRWELQGHFWKSHLLLHENWMRIVDENCQSFLLGWILVRTGMHMANEQYQQNKQPQVTDLTVGLPVGKTLEWWHGHSKSIALKYIAHTWVKLCTFQSMTLEWMTMCKSVTTLVHHVPTQQQPFQLQSWELSQSISDFGVCVTQATCS